MVKLEVILWDTIPVLVDEGASMVMEEAIVVSTTTGMTSIPMMASPSGPRRIRINPLSSSSSSLRSNAEYDGVSSAP